VCSSETSTAPRKKKSKARQSIERSSSSSSGPIATIRKCICCDEYKKIGSTKAFPLDTIIEHIASIFAVEDNSDLSSWPFLAQLVKLNYFTEDDLTIFKDIKVLESSHELSFYNDLITTVNEQLTSSPAGTNVSSFQASLQITKKSLAASLKELSIPLQTKRDRQSSLTRLGVKDDDEHWTNKLKNHPTNSLPPWLEPYLQEGADNNLVVRVCKTSLVSSTASKGSDDSCLSGYDGDASCSSGSNASPFGELTGNTALELSLAHVSPVSRSYTRSRSKQPVDDKVSPPSQVFSSSTSPPQSAETEGCKSSVAKILRNITRSPTTKRKRSRIVHPPITPIHCMLSSTSEYNDHDNSTISFAVPLSIDDFSFTKFTPPITSDMKEEKFYCAICKTPSTDTNATTAMIISPLGVDPLVAVALSLIRISPSSSYGVTSDIIRTIVDCHSQCCTVCLKTALELLNDYVRDSIKTLDATTKCSILVPYIANMRCKEQQQLSSVPHNKIDILNNEIEMYVINVLLEKGVVRCKDIIEVFGHRLGNRYKDPTASGNRRIAEFCQKELIPLMGSKYNDILYVIESEVGTFHPKYHSWDNGFFKYIGPHSLYVAGTYLLKRVSMLAIFACSIITIGTTLLFYDLLVNVVMCIFNVLANSYPIIFCLLFSTMIY